VAIVTTIDGVGADEVYEAFRVVFWVGEPVRVGGFFAVALDDSGAVETGGCADFGVDLGFDGVYEGTFPSVKFVESCFEVRVGHGEFRRVLEQEVPRHL